MEESTKKQKNGEAPDEDEIVAELWAKYGGRKLAVLTQANCHGLETEDSTIPGIWD